MLKVVVSLLLYATIATLSRGNPYMNSKPPGARNPMTKIEKILAALIVIIGVGLIPLIIMLSRAIGNLSQVSP